jgi:hypothetical protein
MGWQRTVKVRVLFTRTLHPHTQTAVRKYLQAESGTGKMLIPSTTSHSLKTVDLYVPSDVAVLRSCSGSADL